MRFATAAFLVMAAATAAAQPAAPGPTAAVPPAEARTAHAHARLLAEHASVTPGRPLAVLLALDLQPGWHTYWRNPGDSGEPTRLEWELPAGFAASGIEWPRPQRLPLPPLANYGYKGRALHLVEITVPERLPPGEVTLAARARWLVCSDVCIPEEAELALRLPVAGAAPGPAGVAPAVAPLFAAARASLPHPAPAAAVVRPRGEDALELVLAPAWREVLDGAREPLFFPYVDGAVEPAAEQPLVRGDDGAHRLTLRPGWRLAQEGLDAVAADGMLGGVLVATLDGELVGWEVHARVAP